MRPRRKDVKASTNGTYNANGLFQYRLPTPQPTYADMTGGNDGAIELAHTDFDAASNATQQHVVELNHDDTDGFSLGGGTPSGGVRRTTHSYFDAADRILTMVDYGAGDEAEGAVAWKSSDLPDRDTGDSTTFTSSANRLITQYAYEMSTSRLSTVTDPKQIKTKTFYDDLGRRLFVVENHQGTYDPTAGIGTVVAGQNRTTGWVYNGLHKVAKLTAYNSGGTTNQETEYLYTDDYNATLAELVKYPDGNTTVGTGADNVQMTYNLDGSIATRTDQRGVVMTYTYDNTRRLSREGATTIPTGVDDAVKSIGRSYDSLGRVQFVTSYAAADGTGTVRNQVKYTYGSYGKLVWSEQSHAGAVAMGTPSVQYAYDVARTMNLFTANLRQRQMTYPSGRIIHTTYGVDNSTSDRLHRLHKFQENAGYPGADLIQYAYNGTARLAVTDYAFPDVKLDLYQGTAGTYAGYDRFGRTIDHRWQDYGTPVDVDRIKYGHDYAGNRTWRENVVAAANGQNHDEFYTYDGLQRLKDSQRGNLTGSPYSGVTSKNFAQDWSLDQLGNWPTFKQDNDGNGWDLEQDRSHNAVNEISSIIPYSSIVQPAHDAAGNMTTMPSPLDQTQSPGLLVYDAWNRLARIWDDFHVNVALYEYDGLHRRIVRDETGLGGDKRHFYYNERWQVLEERVEVSGTINPKPVNQYVWHPYYVDALAVRYYDENSDGAGIVRHWYTQDANFNVTAVVNDSGTALERYSYTPYGEVTFLNPDFSVKVSQTSAIGNNYLYTGRERDPETGLQLNRHRYYHAVLGRWLTRDPIGYADGYSLYAAYFVPSDLDPFGTKKKQIPDVLRDLCDSCCTQSDAQKRACKLTATQISLSLSNAWRDTAKNPGPNTSRDQVHGYLCWDWADLYERTCDKYGGKYWEAEHRSIIRKKRGVDDTTVHHYTRFCACGSDKKECCIDLDDGWFHRGVYYHDPGYFDNHRNWEPCPLEGRGDDHEIPVYPLRK